MGTVCTMRDIQKHCFLKIVWEVWETNSLVLNYTFSYIFVHDSEHLETIGTKTFVISSLEIVFQEETKE